MKNVELIRQNVSEAIEQLKAIENALISGNEYDEPAFSIDLGHAYHHLNFAWNIRNVSEKDAIECNKENLKKWSMFPVRKISEYE